MDDNKKESMEQKVYEEIREAILDRRIFPGNQLIERVISEKLSVSRTPIRNAIKRLADEELVVMIPNRGAFVNQPSIEEIVQANEMRIGLEKIAASLALIHGDDESIDSLEKLIDREREAIISKDFDGYAEINKEFHIAVARMGNNVFLVDFIEKIMQKINIYLFLYDMFPGLNLEDFRSPDEHRAIVHALRKRDKNGLEACITRHIELGLKDFRENKDKIDKKVIFRML